MGVYGEVKWESLGKKWDAEANFNLYKKLLFKKLIVLTIFFFFKWSIGGCGEDYPNWLYFDIF